MIIAQNAMCYISLESECPVDYFDMQYQGEPLVSIVTWFDIPS